MTKKTLMIDMDDVLVQGNFLEIVQNFLGRKINIDEVKSYFLQSLVPEERQEEFWNYLKDKKFYQNYDLVENAFSVIEKLNKKYDIYVVTSFIWRNTDFNIDLSGNLLQEKYYFLQEKLPFLGPEKYIFLRNKKMLNFDIKIDDCLDNLENASIKILFDAWHNRNLTKEEEKSVKRVTNWQEIYNILK